MKRQITLVLGLMMIGGTVLASETVLDIAWDKVAGKAPIGRVAGVGSQAQFEVTNESAKPMEATILVLDKPGVTLATYAIVGEVSYRDVEGEAYLEMSSYFSDGGCYFSKTLGAGALAPMSESSAGRRFVLPFFVKGSERPTKLALKVVMPESGTVVIGPLSLVQYSPGEDPLAVPGQWWSDKNPGMVGVIGGSVGALIGILGGLTGWLASKGRARRFVMAVGTIMLGVGIASLVTGVVAVICRQPYVVYYPLLLIGLILTVVMGARLPYIRRSYEERELREMSAQDAVGR
jgi:hypothetical protein